MAQLSLCCQTPSHLVSPASWLSLAMLQEKMEADETLGGAPGRAGLAHSVPQVPAAVQGPLRR